MEGQDTPMWRRRWTHQLTVRAKKQLFSGKKDVGVAQPVLALWLGKSWGAKIPEDVQQMAGRLW